MIVRFFEIEGADDFKQYGMFKECRPNLIHTIREMKVMEYEYESYIPTNYPNRQKVEPIKK